MRTVEELAELFILQRELTDTPNDFELEVSFEEAQMLIRYIKHTSKRGQKLDRDVLFGLTSFTDSLLLGPPEISPYKISSDACLLVTVYSYTAEARDRRRLGRIKGLQRP